VSADTLYATLDSLGMLVDEYKIHLEEDGFEIRAVDPANVGTADCSLSADTFERRACRIVSTALLVDLMTAKIQIFGSVAGTLKCVYQHPATSRNDRGGIEITGNRDDGAV
jgi:hypothetical protein